MSPLTPNGCIYILPQGNLNSIALLAYSILDRMPEQSPPRQGIGELSALTGHMRPLLVL